MKTLLLSLFIFSATSMATNLPQEPLAEASAQHQLRDILLKSKTVGGFIELIAQDMDADTIKFLRAKTAGISQMPVYIEEKDKVFSIQIEKQAYSFAIEGKEGINTMARVNNKLVVYDPNKAISSLWQDIQSTMPKTTASAWPDLLPQAHAFTGFAWVAGIILLQTGATAYFTNIHNCQLYNHFDRQCKTGEIGERGALAVAYFDQSLKGKISVSCSKSRNTMRECIKNFVKDRVNTLVVPSDLRAYFNMPLDTPFRKATAGGMPATIN